jgi:hypothetical protein
MGPGILLGPGEVGWNSLRPKLGGVKIVDKVMLVTL